MDYQTHLSKDKRLRTLIAEIELEELEPKKNIFIALVSAIASQQLNTKVAAIIFARFIALYNNKVPKPETIQATPDEALRGIGFSYQKIKYIKAIAQFATKNKMSYAYINKMTDAEIIAYFTQITGVGVWTVEMLLIFTLTRPNVFSLGDYGLQMGAKHLYNLDNSHKKTFLAELNIISEKWQPYRSYAARYLWRYKDVVV